MIGILAPRERAGLTPALLPPAVACALLAVLTGCGDRPGENGEEWVVERDTVGDTVVVRTLAGSVWNAPATLIPEVRVGSLAGADEYLFGRIVALAVDARGNMYVFDEQAPALRQYAADGTYVRTFGRQGGGPGEYRQPDGGSIAVLPDGRVALRDPANARINVYSPEGEPLESWRIGGGMFVSRGLVVDAAGNVYTQVFGPGLVGMARFSPDGEPVDTIPAPTWDYSAPTVLAQSNGSSQRWTVPFSPTGQWAFSPLGYMLGGVSDRYRIDLFRPDEQVLRIERRVETVAVTPGEKAAEEHRVTRAMRRLRPDWTWNGPAMPDTKPPFRQILVGQDGRIWVLLRTPGQEAPEDAEDAAPGEPAPPTPWREPVVFDVFEPDGTYLGEVHAPTRFQTYPAPVFGAEHVWAVMEDDLGVQYPTRFGIAPAGTRVD